MQLGHVMLDLDGLALTQDEQQLLQHPQVGGVILFSRNYESPQQLNELVKAIRAANSSRRLLLAVDQEGGRVQRFKTGFTELPPMQEFGRLYEQDPEMAKQAARDMAWLMATELLNYDLDFSFAPVLDLNCGISEVIGNRSFHADPKIVAELGAAVCKGMQEAGMATVGKHFPGHGSVAADSHIALPIDERPLTQIAEQDLVPFHLLANHLTAVMPAHIIYSKVDPEPAGFSPYWLQTVLRQELQFNGAIFSDDLGMAGAEVGGSFSERAQKALHAGCDMVLVCNNRTAAIEVLNSLGYDIRLESQNRLLAMQASSQINHAAEAQRLQQQKVAEQLHALFV